MVAEIVVWCFDITPTVGVNGGGNGVAKREDDRPMPVVCEGGCHEPHSGGLVHYVCREIFPERIFGVGKGNGLFCYVLPRFDDKWIPILVLYE